VKRPPPKIPLVKREFLLSQNPPGDGGSYSPKIPLGEGGCRGIENLSGKHPPDPLLSKGDFVVCGRHPFAPFCRRGIGVSKIPLGEGGLRGILKVPH